MKNLLFAAILVPILAFAAMKTPKKSEPIYVYMLQDTNTKLWYRTNFFNLVEWSEQNRGHVWTVESEMLASQKNLLGARNTRSKKFVLLPCK